MSYKDIESIVKEYGRHKGKVWLTPPTYPYNVNQVQLKYDNTRRYFMSWIGCDTLIRVPQDVFESNVRFLLKKGYTISF